MSWKIKDTKNWQQLLSNHGYSESSLAREIGITYQSIWRYRKKGDAMRPENARKISKLLGGNIKDFFISNVLQKYIMRRPTWQTK